MAQAEINLRDLYRVIRKRRWIIILTPILMGLATFTFTEPPIPVYRAEALVKISRSSTVTGLMMEVVSYGSYDNMATQIVVVTSRPVLEKVAAALNLSGDGKASEDVIDDLRSQVSAGQRESSDILSITARAPTQEEAIALANTVAEVYIDLSSSEKNARINEKVEFIRSRLKEATQDLRVAGESVNDHKQANETSLNLTASQGIEIDEKLFQYQQKLRDGQSALAILKDVQETKEYERLSQIFIHMDDAGIRALADELTRKAAAVAELRAKKADLSRYQTKESPQVIAVSSQVTASEQRLASSLVTLIERMTPIVAEYQRMERALSQHKSELLRHPEVLSRLDNLQAVLSEKQELASNLRKQLQEAEIQQKEKLEDFSLVERAHSSEHVLQTSRYYRALVGALIGLLLGGVFAFVLESMDTSIGTIEDVEKFIGAEVLGVVPHLETEDVVKRMDRHQFAPSVTEEDLKSFGRLSTHFDPRSIASEAYRTMRTHVSSVMERTNSKIVMVASSARQEGKTTTATNLATVFAQTGQKTLLIDADLRLPGVDRIFGLKKEPGLSDVLLGTREFKECCRGFDDIIMGKFGLKVAQATPGMEYLYVLPSGRSVDNSAELLNSTAVDKLFAEIREEFDVIIVDGAPIMPVADASILAPKVDGVILAYQIGRIGRDVLRRSKLRLESLGARILGIIMNDIQAEIDYSHGDYTYYRYGYGGASEKVKTGPWGALSKFKKQASKLTPWTDKTPKAK